MALDPELSKYLTLIGSELRFARFLNNEGKSIAPDLTGDVAAMIALGVGLEGTWSSTPTASEVDYEDFWRRDYRNSMTCFRCALYDPPYQAASDIVIDSVDADLYRHIFHSQNPPEEYRVFRLSTEESSFFSNDWWDYLWVAAHRNRGEVVVVYGTATD